MRNQCTSRSSPWLSKTLTPRGSFFEEGWKEKGEVIKKYHKNIIDKKMQTDSIIKKCLNLPTDKTLTVTKLYTFGISTLGFDSVIIQVIRYG